MTCYAAEQNLMQQIHTPGKQDDVAQKELLQLFGMSNGRLHTSDNCKNTKS